MLENNKNTPVQAMTQDEADKFNPFPDDISGGEDVVAARPPTLSRSVGNRMLVIPAVVEGLTMDADKYNPFPDDISGGEDNGAGSNKVVTVQNLIPPQEEADKFNAFPTNTDPSSTTPTPGPH